MLSYATAQDLAAAALYYRALRQVASSITFRRDLDAARGLKPYPTSFLNVVGDHPYPYFHYSPAITRFPQHWGREIPATTPSWPYPSLWFSSLWFGFAGCEGCPGFSRESSYPYTRLGVGVGAEVATECGDACESCVT